MNKYLKHFKVKTSTIAKSDFARLRQRLSERSFTSTRFHDFETASKSMLFGGVYTEPFSPKNPSRDGINERCTTC